jgi:hypothetical protein
MLREIKTGRKQDGEYARRWFADDYFDLIVWLDDKGGLYGFQLCYGLGRNEHAFTWKQDSGFAHNLIDDGEQTPAKNMSPILVPDGVFPLEQIISQFAEGSSGIDAEVSGFVLGKLREYSENNMSKGSS